MPALDSGNTLQRCTDMTDEFWIKFNIGDRVAVNTSAYDFNGMVGTIVEKDDCPWIRFDSIVSTEQEQDNLNPHGVKSEDWKPGYMGCVDQDDLELVQLAPKVKTAGSAPHVKEPELPKLSNQGVW